MNYAIIFAVAVVGAFIQAVTGFGAAIFIMLFISHLMPITDATALNGVMCLASNVTNFLKYRKQISWKLIPVPVAVNFVLSFAAIRLSKMMDTGLLKRIFGAVLVILALYFLFLAKKVSVRPTLGASAVCGCISGITGGMFGASGPPLVIYFVSATDSKGAYIGTMQTFCLLTGLWTLFVRLGNGFYKIGMVPLLILGTVGVLIGQFIGSRVADKISANTLKTCVYLVLAVSGLVNLLG